jgi:alkylation response protein AidB-like acyl-CoA dehydrogenase
VTLTPAQLGLQKRARALARETIAPRAAEVDRTEQYPWDNVKALADAGFFGMTIPKQYGGLGLGFLEAALVVDEMSQVCGVTGRIAVEANMGAISAVMHYGTDAQKKLAAELVLGGDKPAICITEPGAGSALRRSCARWWRAASSDASCRRRGMGISRTSGRTGAPIFRL